MKRLRVLISSHEFSPERGSECSEGWNICTRMAAIHDVTVLCASGPPFSPTAYKDALERFHRENPGIPGLTVECVAQPPDAIRYARINRQFYDTSDGVGSRTLFFRGLNAWHRAAYQTALRLGTSNFDVVHQLTPISFRRPGYLWRLDLPFFWGPIGGMYKVPSAFARWGGFRTWLFERLRAADIDWHLHLSPTFQAAARRAAVVWTITDDERRQIDRVAGPKSVPMIDTAAQVRGIPRTYNGDRALRVCWSGRPAVIKALPLLLNAMAQLEQPHRVSVDVLGGGGSETARWQALARELRLDNITWHGRLPYQAALAKMNEADVFVHTSFREAASNVVPEALGSGLPVVCHDVCGMAVAVDASCGIKVPFVSPAHSIRGFRDALERLLANPGLVRELSVGALKRAAHLSWDAKVAEMAETYDRYVGTPHLV